MNLPINLLTYQLVNFRPHQKLIGNLQQACLQ